MERLKELEKKYEELGQEIEKLKKQKLQEKWTPNQKEIYYFINGSRRVDCNLWNNDDTDNYRRDFLKIFKTREEAEEYLNYIKARKEASYEFTQEEWEDDNIEKHYFYYNYYKKEFSTASDFTARDINKIYFKDKDEMQAFIDKYSKQIKKFELGIEEN